MRTLTLSLTVVLALSAFAPAAGPGKIKGARIQDNVIELEDGELSVRILIARQPTG